MKLQERAMLISLNLSCWTGQRLDKQTTEEVQQFKGTSKDSGKWEKYLVPKESLEAIVSAHGRARNRLNSLSLPWADGQRIITSQSFPIVSNAMEEERNKCEPLYAAFFAMYPQLMADAPRRLNGTYRAADFPSESAIKSKFGFRLRILPVPDKADFRVALGDEVEREIRDEMERDKNEQIAEAQRDIWGRVLGRLKHFMEVMRDPDKKLYASTITNLADIAALAPAMMIVPDPKLEALSQDITQLVAGLDAETLRKNDRMRKHMGAQAQSTLDKVKEIERKMAFAA